jgi:hypothetical protein
MGRPDLYTIAQIAERSGGPPATIPQHLEDMPAILSRWFEMLRYDVQTGDLIWRYLLDNRINGFYVDDFALKAFKRGPRGNRTRIDGFVIPTARLVWLLHHRAWPSGALHRRDNDPYNDRIENLYVAEGQAPGERGRPRFRPVGVSRFYGRWKAYVRSPGGKTKWLGTFDTEEEAAAARKAWDEGDRDVSDDGPNETGRLRLRPVGVSKLYGKWMAYVRLPDGGRKQLGVFDTEEAAAAARKAWDEGEDLL